MVMHMRVWSGILLAGLLGSMVSCSYRARPVILILSNPIDLQRVNEGVVVPASKLPAWVSERSVSLQDGAGRAIPFQQDDLDGDGKTDEFYFQISLAPWETASIHFRPGSRSDPPENTFKVFLDHDLVSIETPSRTVVSKGPEDIQVFIPSRKSAVLTCGYRLPSLIAQESRNRILSQGPLRVVVEQKALWRASSEAYIFNHRLSVALNDPLIRSGIEKIRWPKEASLPPLAFELENGPFRLKSFSTRWLIDGEGSKATAWKGSLLFRAGSLLQPRPVVLEKKDWRLAFNEEGTAVSLACMVTAGNIPVQEWDRLSERNQQRWLNPIEVFVSD